MLAGGVHPLKSSAFRGALLQQLSWYKRISATPNRSNEMGREEIAATYLRYYVLK